MNQSIFLWINQDGGNHYQWLDTLMLFFSKPMAAIIPLGILVAYVIVNDRSRWRVLIGVFLVVGIDDWIGGVIKDIVAADRPCAELLGVRILDGCGANSFPSNHAANTAAFASYIFMFYRKAGYFIWVIPLIVGISRIYVGAHYPGDVLAGWFLGSMVGVAGYWIHARYIYKGDATTPPKTQDH